MLQLPEGVSKAELLRRERQAFADIQSLRREGAAIKEIMEVTGRNRKFVHAALHHKNLVENTIETYLCKQVKKAGGMVRKLRFIGVNGAPDRLIIWPGRGGDAIIHMVETKSHEGDVKVHQKREHKRLVRYGVAVYVFRTLTQVDEYIERMKRVKGKQKR